MKAYVVATLFVLFALLIMQCSEKDVLEIVGYIPAQPAQQLIIDRVNLVSNGDYTPGYQSGNIRSDRVTLDWQASTDPNFKCYKIFESDVQRMVITDPEISSYVDSNLVQDTYFDYKVVAQVKSGLFKSDTVRVKTPQFLPPDSLSFNMIDSSTVQIFWHNRAESASQFNVYRSFNPDSLFQLIGTPSEPTFVDNTVQNQQTYYYRVEAFNAFETTPLSDPLFVFVNYIMNPPTLQPLQQIPGTRSVRVMWNDNSNAESGFRIYRALSGNPLSQVGTVPADATQFIDDDTTSALQVGETYQYAVTAYNQIEETGFSNTRTITIVQPTTFLGYSTGFEQILGPEWTFESSTAFGQITRSNFDAHTGQYMLLMDVTTSGTYNYNRAYLHLDLSSLSSSVNCYLNFYFKTFGEEIDFGDDVVEVSTDGISWTKVYDFISSDIGWTYVSINLRDFYFSQPYSSTYVIKWQQYDNFPYNTDGIGLDDVEIVVQ